MIPRNKNMRQINQVGLNLIQEFEGLRLQAYKPVWDDPWTIGAGHTKGVYEGMVITEEEAWEFLREDVKDAEDTVNELVEVKLTDNQFAALVSFVFNLGSSSFQISTLLKKLNDSDYEGASKEFLRWNKAGDVILPGLTRRREAEKALFLS